MKHKNPENSEARTNLSKREVAITIENAWIVPQLVPDAVWWQKNMHLEQQSSTRV